MSDPTFRAEVLARFGATSAQAQELLAYGESRFDPGGCGRLAAMPLPDEDFIRAWRRYAADTRRLGVVGALRRRLVQFRFPIEHGISASAAYRVATGRGELPEDGIGGPHFHRPDAIRLHIQATPAGHMPVIVAEHREDFVALVRILAYRNEPEPVPPSMGACTVGGLINWDRIAALRRAARSPSWEAWWLEEWPLLAPRKELYQDRVIVVSSGPYSGVAADAVGLDADTWRALSLTIRIEHECAHYFTRRVFGSMRKALLDELIADYAGIVAATGRFRADWFLRFLGLERYPRYREGGRLENYRGQPPLTDGAFSVLQHLAVEAAGTLERLGEDDDPTVTLAALALLTIEDLAAPDGPRRLRRAWSTASQARRSDVDSILA